MENEGIEVAQRDKGVANPARRGRGGSCQAGKRGASREVIFKLVLPISECSAVDSQACLGNVYLACVSFLGLAGTSSVDEKSAPDLEAEIVVQGIDTKSVLEAHENRRWRGRGRYTGGVLTHNPRRRLRLRRGVSDITPRFNMRFLPLVLFLGDLRFELLYPLLERLKLLHRLLELPDLGGYVFRPSLSRMGRKSNHCNGREGLSLVSQTHCHCHCPFPVPLKIGTALSLSPRKCHASARASVGKAIVAIYL